MAAGYISSTSGIGVADPYDAGLYEAQQDALNRIDKNKQLDLVKQKQDQDFIVKMSGDVKDPNGFLVEDTDAIRQSYTKAKDTLGRYLAYATKAPNSQIAQQLKKEADDAKANYLFGLQQSNEANKMVFEAQKADGNKFDLDAIKENVAAIRTQPLGSDGRTQAMQNMFKPRRIPSTSEAVGKALKGFDNIETERVFDPASNSYVTTQTKAKFLTPEQQKGAAVSMYATNQDIRNAVDKEVSELIGTPSILPIENSAKQKGISIQEAYLEQELQNQNAKQETLKSAFKPESAYQKAYARAKAEGDVDAEEALSDVAYLAAVFEGHPSVIDKDSASAVDTELKRLKDLGIAIPFPIDGAVRVKGLENRTIGSTVKKDITKYADGSEDVKEVIIPTVIESAFRTKDGALVVKVAGENQLKRYANLSQAINFLTYSKDPQKQAKATGAVNRAVEDLGAGSSYNIDTKKIVPLTKEQMTERDNMYSPKQEAQTKEQAVPSKSQAEWNAAWSRLKKGEKLIGFDGKTYIKK